tara:strand:+ start:209 stop:766 length:558 start_codon:yes stop_codon:yes gene_type:complete
MATPSAHRRPAGHLGLFALAVALAGAGAAVARDGPAPAAPHPVAEHHQTDAEAAAAVARIRSLYESDTFINEADPANANAWFSADLAADISRLYGRPGEYGIGFAYLIDGQDEDIAGITYTFHAAGPDSRPTLRVRFTNFGEPVDREFIFDDDWRIANIHAFAPDGTEKWNLRDAVTDALQDAGP